MMKNRKDLSGRIPELDIARGIAVLLMILDHCMYDLWGLMPMLFPEFRGSAVVQAAKWYWNCDPRYYIRIVILFVFMGLTGVCCSFARSNLKRGLKLLAVALGLTLVTYIIGIVIDDPEMMIVFGVLHCIALALILIGLLEKFIKNKWFYLAAGVLLIAVGFLIGKPEYASYSSGNIFLLIPQAIAGIKSCGSDCFAFPLYGGQIFIGVFLGKLLYKDRKSLIPKAKETLIKVVFGRKNAINSSIFLPKTRFVQRIPQYRNGPIEFIGRNSLIVYIAHQILIPVILTAVLLCCGYTPAF